MPAGASNLDLGCGPGRIAGVLAEGGLRFGGRLERPGWFRASLSPDREP